MCYNLICTALHSCGILLWPCHSIDGLIIIGLWLWFLRPLSTIFQLYDMWWSVLLVEETGENQTTKTDLSHITDKLTMSGIWSPDISGDRWLLLVEISWAKRDIFSELELQGRWQVKNNKSKKSELLILVPSLRWICFHVRNIKF